MNPLLLHVHHHRTRVQRAATAAPQASRLARSRVALPEPPETPVPGPRTRTDVRGPLLCRGFRLSYLPDQLQLHPANSLLQLRHQSSN